MTPTATGENFNMTRQSISKHLKILSECEIVTQRQEEREIYYALEMDRLKQIDICLREFRVIWETRFTQLADLISNP